MVSRASAAQERPREDWIEIPVPALVSYESLAQAQELLHDNKKIRAGRRTITPSIAQELVSCQKMRICVLENVIQHIRAQNPLLQMYRLR